MTGESTRAWRMAGMVGLGLALLYVFTAQRGVSWQDAGEFQRRALLGDFAGVEGIARAHPLYVAALQAIARIFAPDAVTWALNAFSGLGLALAAAACAWLVHRLTRDTLAAVCAGLLLGLAHMPWWMATLAEVYTWSLALFLVETALLYALLSNPQPRLLFWLALIGGMGLSVHNFALLSLPVWTLAAVWLIRRRMLPAWSLFPAAAAWVVGAAPVLALVAVAAKGSQGLAGAIADALFSGAYRSQVLGVTPSVSRSLVIGNLALFAFSLASPLWLAAVRGWQGIRRIQPFAFAVCLALLTGIHVLFFIRYFVPDQATFCLPTLGLLSIWTGMGIAALAAPAKVMRRAWAAVVCVGLACPVLVYGGAATAARSCAWRVSRARALPFRDEARYWLLPWKQAEHSAADFAHAALAQCGNQDIVYADSTAAGPLTVTLLLTGPVRRNRPWVISYYDPWTRSSEAWAAFQSRMAGRPLYVVSPVPGYVPAGLLNEGCEFVPTGVLYSVNWKTSP